MHGKPGSVKRRTEDWHEGGNAIQSDVCSELDNAEEICCPSSERSPDAGPVELLIGIVVAEVGLISQGTHGFLCGIQEPSLINSVRNIQKEDRREQYGKDAFDDVDPLPGQQSSTADLQQAVS